MSITATNKMDIRYTVNSSTGVTSTTQVDIYGGKKVSKVEGADGWSLLGSVVTVSVTHSSPRNIIIYFAVTEPSSVTGPFNTVRQLWADLFMLIVFCAIVGLMSGLMRGDMSGGVFLKTIIALVLGTAMIFVLLRVVENLG